MVDFDTRTGSAIADALSTSGCYIGPSIFGTELTLALGRRAAALSREGKLSGASVGHHDDAPPDAAHRGDETRWLTDAPDDESERDALRGMQGLRAELNEALYIGAHDLQMHFAHYAAGTSYTLHRDRFVDDEARLVSFVVYLNAGWPDDAGGELVLYADDDSGDVLARTLPREGTMACFLSDRFPHEVLPATRARYSLSGWMSRLPR